MGKAVIVYASTTGNTEAMANAIKEGAPEADLFSVADTSSGVVSGYDTLILGSPAMGSEVLEDSMESLFSELEGSLAGKKVALFGSYDWGDGQWLRDWADRVTAAGATLVGEPLKIQTTPDDAGLASCRDFGKAVVSA
ncbi:MAG: flavodoxin [Treponema sp.]|nr:flavodoxin [Treponema sp.]